MRTAYHIRVLFLALVSNEKARSDRNRSERASMIRLELGTATRAQSGSIHGAEDNQKVQLQQLLTLHFLRSFPAGTEEKLPANRGRKVTVARPWLDHFKAILRQNDNLSC
jgi:hypothetical protein